MEQYYVVISDIEMGKGDIMDDFSDDDDFIKFINFIGNHEEETTIVLNGDIFDFLKMDYKGEYPRSITEKISLWKLERVFESHPKIFKAFANFLKNPHHKLYFVIGNHDFDLVWPKLQERLRSYLNAPKQINFGFQFDQADFHIQHGHLIDPFFVHKPDKPFLQYRGRTILNLPMGSYIVFAYLIPFKKKFPQEERLYPRSKIAKYHPEYYREISKIKWLYMFKVGLDRLLHFWDPTFRINFWPCFKHILEFGFDFMNEERFLPKRMQELHKKYPEKNLFVLGHTHIFADMLYKTKRFLFTDTWRNELNLLDKNLSKKKKSFVEIQVENNQVKHSAIKIFEPKNVGV